MYDAESQEMLEELQDTSEVQSVAIWDSGKDGGKDGVERTLTSPSRSSWLAFRTGRAMSGIRVRRSPQNRPSLAKTDACWLSWQTNWCS